MLNIILLALKSLWRDWRAAEWLLVCFALFIAIAATTSIHFYTDRIMRGLDKQGARLLGGELVISSPSPLPVAWEQKAREMKLRTAQVWSYLSVVSSKNQKSSNAMQLVSLQAVSDNYPLSDVTPNLPDPHTIWVEPRLLPLLSIEMNDELVIGAATFQVKKLLTSDLDTLSSGFIIAPRAMMRLADVPATQTVLPGSRVDYRLLLVGDASALKNFKSWITPLLSPSQKLIDTHSQQFALQNIMQNTENYLQLILLVCLLLSGVAISLSIQQYVRRHYAQIALWRCLGASHKQILTVFILQLIIIASIIGVIGIVMGYVAQEAYAYLFQDFIRFELPASGFSPILLGFITSNIILFAFSYPILSELPRTSPLYLWRNEINLSVLSTSTPLMISLSCMVLFILWFMNFSLLSIYFFLGLFLSIVFLYGVSLIIISILRVAVNHSEGSIRRGISQIVQYPFSFSLQFIGLNLILVAIIISACIRSNMINNWKQSLPETSPNFFAINIDKSDITRLSQFFQNQHIDIEGIYPMVRGRLIALNGQSVLSAVPAEAKNNNALHRELNLSWMWNFPSDNKIVKGPTWTLRDRNKALVSVEYGLANDLHLKLGDELTFQIGERKIDAVIMNFRTLVWSSIHPNFFMIFPPGLLDNFPTTFITSFHLDNKQKIILNDIVKIFPNITIIDMANVLLQIQNLVSKIIAAMQYLFIFALGLSILIFIASLQTTMDERQKTYSLLRILGAERHYIRRSLIVEFILLFMLISVTAMILGLLSVYLLEINIFNQ